MRERPGIIAHLLLDAQSIDSLTSCGVPVCQLARSLANYGCLYNRRNGVKGSFFGFWQVVLMCWHRFWCVRSENVFASARSVDCLLNSVLSKFRAKLVDTPF